MIALLTTVLLASFLGSLHCAAMCGPFVALAACGTQSAPRVQVSRKLGGSPFTSALAYHAGRFCTYTLLGATAGALGAMLNFGGGLLGLQRCAAVLAGALMVTFGLAALLRIAGVPLRSPQLPPWLQKSLSLATRYASALPPASRAVLIGLLTTLIPCGWLYAFVVTAAGTASPLFGALTMAAFWAGTLPMLVGLGFGIRLMAIPLRRHAPVLTGAALLAVGLLTLAGRLSIDGAALQRVARVPKNVAGATIQAAGLNSDNLPCCKPTTELATSAREGVSP